MGWWWWWGTWSERRPKASRESSSTDAEAMSLWKLLFYYGRKIGWKCITKCRLNFMIDVCSHLRCIASIFFLVGKYEMICECRILSKSADEKFLICLLLGKVSIPCCFAQINTFQSKYVCMTRILLLVICILLFTSTYLNSTYLVPT